MTYRISSAQGIVTQTKAIEMKIESLLNSGTKDKSLIYSTIVSELKCPRPTVRRVCHNYIKKLQKQAEILKDEEEPKIESS